MGQDGLDQHLGGVVARQHGLHPLQREAVLGTEGEDDRVVVCRRLELEVERDAEALAQRQAESAVDPSAVRGMDDELRSFAVVVAALHHDPFTRGQVAQSSQPGGAVGGHLLRHVQRHTSLLHDELARCLAVTGAQDRLERRAQLGDRPLVIARKAGNHL